MSSASDWFACSETDAYVQELRCVRANHQQYKLSQQFLNGTSAHEATKSQ